MGRFVFRLGVNCLETTPMAGDFSGLELRWIRRVAVDGFRVEDFFALGVGEWGRWVMIFSDRNDPVEATSVADMAIRAASSLDPKPDAILIVVDAHFPDFLDEAATGSLVPENLATPAPIVRFAGLDRFLQGLGIHVGVHQNLAGREIGCHTREVAVGVEFGGELVALFDLFDRGAFGKRCTGL